VHWPVAVRTVKPATTTEAAVFESIKMPMHHVWPQMEALVEKGLAKSIGLSNFNVQMMWDLLSYCKIKPVANEIEINPYIAQTELVRFCFGHGILPIAYCPIARGANLGPNGNLLELDIVKNLAQKYRKSPAQVLLSYGLSRGYSIIPKSQNFERQVENFDIFDFKLRDEEIEELSKLNIGARICNK